MTARIKIFSRLALEVKSLKRAFRFSLIVGLILNLINQGELLIDLKLAELNYPKLILTLIVPFLVSLFSSAMTRMELLPGNSLPAEAVLRCKNCNSEYRLSKDEPAVECKNCGRMTVWKIDDMK